MSAICFTTGKWSKYINREHREVPLSALRDNTSLIIAESLDIELTARGTGRNSDFRDFRGLAAAAGLNFKMVESIRHSTTPTLVVLYEWQRGNIRMKPTFGSLVDALIQLERFDVLDECKNSMVADAEEYKKIKLPLSDCCCHRPRRHENMEHLTIDDNEMFGPTHYDAFICCNEESEDRIFVRQMLQVLENMPYNLKLFCSWRDGVPGVNIFENDAKVISERCTHFVAVLSPDYHENEHCTYQASIAIGLLPSGRNIVPLIVRPSHIPNMLSFRKHLDFTVKEERDGKWRLLAVSLSTERPRGY